MAPADPGGGAAPDPISWGDPCVAVAERRKAREGVPPQVIDVETGANVTPVRLA
jgi:hypothetical protein